MPLFQAKKGTTMGKSSKYPSYSNGSVTVNGQTVATNKKNGNSISSNYNMSDIEKGIYDYAQNSFLSSLPQINIFSEDTKKNINSQLDAFKNQGIQTINDTYTPMLNSMKTDIASRFGNFDNSVFMDNLNSIEKNRANAVSDLSENLLSKRSELYNDELTQRYNYLTFLNNLQNQMNSNALAYMGFAQANSDSGNSYNNHKYNSSSDTSNDVLRNALLLAQLGASFYSPS